MQAAHHASLDTSLGADSIALLGPAVTSGATVVQRAAVGTYALRELDSAARRDGRLLLISARRQGTVYALTLDDEVADLPGVLDVAVAAPRAPATAATLFAACADDTLLAFDVASPASSALQTPRPVFDASGTSRIVLAVDVCERAASPPLLAAASSDGTVALFRPARLGWHELLRREAHAQEAWTVLADSERRVLYSGGDDGAFVAYDWDAGKEAFRLRKPHGGVGVTAVAKDRGTDDDWHLWTGGYDDTLRLWDVRAMKQCVAEVGLGGGVWRVRFHPVARNMLLVASMYDGFKVVKREAGSDQLSVACHYEGHESIAYGATWVPALDHQGKLAAMTASFYDHSLQLWTVDDPT